MTFIFFSFTSSTFPFLSHYYVYSFILHSSPTYQSTGNASTGQPYEHGKEHQHDRLDKTDERSIANTLADASRVEKKEKQAEKEAEEVKPTDAAKAHGNEPSRGAKVDEKIEDEEAEIIAKMDAKKAAQH